MKTSTFAPLAMVLLSLAVTAANAIAPSDQLAQWSAQSGKAADAGRGRQFFNANHGKEWSCASCHFANPSVNGRHAATGKVILPLAPAFNAERFADAAKSEKWFRRNCNDVVGRECSAAEKADVLTWLLTVKP